MTINQASVVLKAVTTEDTLAGGLVAFPLVAGLTPEDLLAGQTVYIEVYGRQFTGLAVAIDAEAASVTWPADAPYPLPPGEYNCEFLTTMPAEGGGLPPGLTQVAAQTPVVLVAQEVDPAADLATLTAAYNGMVAAHDELATAHNGLIAAMQASGVMAAGVVATKAKAKK